MSPRLLVLGHSHTRALAQALRPGEEAEVAVVNLRERPDLVDERSRRLARDPEWGQPALVALVMGGNLHNVFALKENPEPFAVGDPVRGRVPPGPERRFVPRDLLRARFQERLDHFLRLERQAHAHFPGTPIVHLASPPPVRALPPLDPGGPPLEGTALMVRYLAFDAAPPDLRLALWEIQTEIARDAARRLGAPFLEPPTEACDPDGLLADGYWEVDPTHGNAAYGRLVLDALLARLAGGTGSVREVA